MKPFLRVEELVMEFRSERPFFGAISLGGDSGGGRHRALDGISFEMNQGESLGICGPSGSGKTTLALCLLGLLRPSSGRLWVEGRELRTLNRREWREFRKKVGVVFQDPYASLNPYMRVSEIIREPLDIHRLGSRSERRRRVEELLEWVGLETGHSHRRATEFSGGERQRIAVARALATRPRLLIADEPVSSLDGLVRGQVMQLLLRLRRELGFTLILISHGLRGLAALCERLLVLEEGRVVEAGDVADVFRRPTHPLTRALLECEGLTG